LKRAYAEQIDQNIQLGIDHVDKEQFLEAYQRARTIAYTTTTIISGFRGAGIVPFDPQHVLERLRTTIATKKTPTPPGSSHSHSSTFEGATPYDIRQLQRQARAIQRTYGSDPLFTQLIKGASRAMENMVLLTDRNEALYTANNKKQEREKQKKNALYIVHEGILSVEQGLELAQNEKQKKQQKEQEKEKKKQEVKQRKRHRQKEQHEAEQQAREELLDSRGRRLPRCSICRSHAHNARTCPERTSMRT
jgi:hypothetical protein